MATPIWQGKVAKVAQVTAYVFGGTWETTDIVVCTIGTRTLSVVAGSTTISAVVDAVVSAWNALSATLYPEFAEITASRSSNSLVLTADEAGLPFTVTVSTTETGGGAADAQTIDGADSSTGSDSTACSGPNFWSVAGNWSTGAVPADSDTPIIDGSVDILYGLAQSAIELSTLTINASFRGKIGLPDRNASGYAEYRTTELTIGAATLTIGAGVGPGSSRIRINCEAEQTALVVYQSARSEDASVPAVQWRGTHASNTGQIYGGSVGIATPAGHTATLATLSVSGGTVNCGSGVTLTTVNNTGGKLFTLSAATTVNHFAGQTTLGAGAHTTANVRGGTLFYESTGTLTNLNVYGPGVASFDNVQSARTVTNAVITKDGTILDQAKTVAWTNGIDVTNASFRQVTLDLGQHLTLTPSAI